MKYTIMPFTCKILQLWRASLFYRKLRRYHLIYNEICRNLFGQFAKIQSLLVLLTIHPNFLVG
jgi:hypothetical protein